MVFLCIGFSFHSGWQEEWSAPGLGCHDVNPFFLWCPMWSHNIAKKHKAAGLRVEEEKKNKTKSSNRRFRFWAPPSSKSIKAQWWFDFQTRIRYKWSERLVASCVFLLLLRKKPSKPSTRASRQGGKEEAAASASARWVCCDWKPKWQNLVCKKVVVQSIPKLLVLYILKMYVKKSRIGLL